MKSKRKPLVVNLDAHMLSELVETVNASCRRAAMEEYLNGDLHAQLLIGGTLVEQCEKSRRNLLNGDVAPHLDVCCCSHTFTTALTDHPYIEYAGCELPEADTGEPDGDCEDFDLVDEEIDDETFAKLVKLPTDKLRQKLAKDYACSEAEYSQTHKADEKLQRRYYEAVCRRFEAAAQYAKAIGSESARLWLEAICLLSPRTGLKHAVRVDAGLGLDADWVNEAYAVAERAQRALWVDVALRALPAAKLPRKTRKPRH